MGKVDLVTVETNKRYCTADLKMFTPVSQKCTSFHE